MNKYFLLPLVFLFIQCRPPQKTTSAPTIILDKPIATNNSLLWQISGNGLTKPSYLYGTIHIISQDDYFLGKNVSKKLVHADQLVMEIDLNDINVAALTDLSLLPKGKTIKDYMSETDYETVRAFFEDSIGIKKFTFEQAYGRMKPFYLDQLIFFRYLGQEKESYEENFKKIAEEKNIPMKGLETFEEQLRFLDEIPLEAQLKDLYKTIKNYTEETNKLGQLVRDYKAQNITAMTKAFEEDEDTLTKQKLVDRRNNDWIPKIKTMIQTKTCFIAVGAGHLGGDKGLISLLRKEGYTVDAISID